MGPVKVPPRGEYQTRVELAQLRALDDLMKLGVSYSEARASLVRKNHDNPVIRGYFSSADGRIYKTYLGGTTTLLPKKHHKKYWYFLRKRGRFVFSEHHPYGDEYTYFKGICI
jgi:hypothetical protein